MMILCLNVVHVIYIKHIYIFIVKKFEIEWYLSFEKVPIQETVKLRAFVWPNNDINTTKKVKLIFSS